MRWILGVIALGLSVGAALADPPDASKRPFLRGDPRPIAPAPQTRPRFRPASEAATPVVVATPAPPPKPKPPKDPNLVGFDQWKADFRGRALALGLDTRTVDDALRAAKYDPDVIKRDRNQSEFTKTIWEYLKSAVSDTRIANGRAALSKHAKTLKAVETEYGVDHQIVVAIWGLESAYGAFRGSNDTISSLATLAYDARRSDFFESQLIAALRILQSGDVQTRDMKGSWAGAMGHTQFMPTSYLDHAVDFTGDGKRNIWDNDPSDALASTAAYLKANGWTTGQPWGVEVRLPPGFDYALADREIIKSPSDWGVLGIRDTQGRQVGNHGPASILLPAGASGAAFMIFDNFEVLESYNTADAYVIGVGHLGDRILGGRGIQGAWPTHDRALTYDERVDMQKLLTAAGFDTVKIDGKIGPLTISAVRRWQQATGRVPDGYASLRVLNALR